MHFSRLLKYSLLLSALPLFGAAPRVRFITPDVVRVRWSPEEGADDNNTGVCVWESDKVDVRRYMEDGILTMRSDSLVVSYTHDKRLIFSDARTGRVLLSEREGTPRVCERVAKERIIYDEASARMEETANGKVTVKDIVRRDTLGYKNRFTVSFTADGEEAIYGLGAHMEDYMNLAGKSLYLTQHNLKAFVPMLVSTGGYGLLFDAGCSMIYSSDIEEGGANWPVTNNFSMVMEAANTIDYYFIKGCVPEKVIEGYRMLTGDVAMMPRYLFGYTQSKERYVSSDDIVNTVKEYRRRKVPLDMIVQDWNYWPQGWGYMKMNREYYPDPKALADSVHALDAKLMVSIWANPQYCPEADDFRDRGFMLEHSVYDAFNPAARDLYWDYANNEFFSNGFDAWWCDSSEPLDGDWNRMPEPLNGKPYTWDDHERRWQLNDAILSESLGAERACLYSLNHSKGIWEHQRAATDRKRVVNLTRSTFAGQQRYGTIVWNGDTHASWDSFRQQIPAGLNYLATGNPYWTMDIGGFFTRKDPRWFYLGEFPEGVKDDGYKEYYTRMFQWGAFLPVMRSHGTDTPREIWQFGEPGSKYYDSLLGMINLRYSLLPYTYSLAAKQSASGYSMARPLAFDFPRDRKVYDIKDQYMFGDIMVSPVTSPGVDKRDVYLPETDALWIDFWTGERHKGGAIVSAAAPIDRLPLFVKGGSIIPTVEPVQHSAASVGKPVTLTVYPGADATFTLYDDEGDTYDFEKGEYQRIAINWNDKKRTLTFAEVEGSYPEAPAKREFRVSVDGKVKTINYDGKKRSLKF